MELFKQVSEYYRDQNNCKTLRSLGKKIVILGFLICAKKNLQNNE